MRHGCDPRERTNACNTSPQRAGSCLTVHRGASDRRGTREIPSRPTATLDRLYGCTLEAFQKISHLCASLWITGDIAPAAATRQSRTAGARRFVTPHRQAPLASDGPPSIPSSVSGVPYRRPLHDTETVPDVQPGTWAPATAEGDTSSCAAALVLDEEPRAAAALDRFSDPLHVRSDQRNGVAALPAPCCLLGRHHAYQESRAPCSFLPEPGQTLRVAVPPL